MAIPEILDFFRNFSGSREFPGLRNPIDYSLNIIYIYIYVHFESVIHVVLIPKPVLRVFPVNVVFMIHE